MDSCPGGGAEIFAKRVRDVICTNKIDGERWLEIARLCHVERREDERDDALRLTSRPTRSASTTSSGSASCRTRRRASSASSRSPSTPTGRRFAHLPATSGLLDLRVIAAARLMLDNLDHVKAYWVQIGEKFAPVALHFGADDLVGTVTEETITHAAGATTEAGLSRARDGAADPLAPGASPFERDAFYERVVRDEAGTRRPGQPARLRAARAGKRAPTAAPHRIRRASSTRLSRRAGDDAWQRERPETAARGASLRLGGPVSPSGGPPR